MMYKAYIQENALISVRALIKVLMNHYHGAEMCIKNNPANGREMLINLLKKWKYPYELAHIKVLISDAIYSRSKCRTLVIYCSVLKLTITHLAFREAPIAVVKQCSIQVYLTRIECL